MYCLNCGAFAQDDAKYCGNCGRSLSDGQPAGAVGGSVYPPGGQYQYGAPDIPTYLWQSIVVTILCCLPAGIVAIVYAARVNSLAAGGDIAGAYEASAKAKRWAWISFWVAVAFTVIYVLFALAA